MSRGDQRERDRAKAQVKQAQKLRATKGGGDPSRRNENDAAALQAKVAAKKANPDPDNSAQLSNEPVVRKKAVAKNDSIDDLLSAGLSSGKKKAARA